MTGSEQPAFEVRLRSRRAQRELDDLQGVDYRRVIARLRELAHNPTMPGCEKLHDDIYRIRVGDFRIIYLIDEQKKRIEVGGIRRRSERTYKRIDRLFG